MSGIGGKYSEHILIVEFKLVNKVICYEQRLSDRIGKCEFVLFLYVDKPLPEPILTQISVATWRYLALTHWDRVTHICVSKLTIIGSDNGLSPDRRQAIVWNNPGIVLIGPLETNFSEILSKIHIFSLSKMHSNMSSGKWLPFCFGLDVLSLGPHYHGHCDECIG